MASTTFPVVQVKNISVLALTSPFLPHPTSKLLESHVGPSHPLHPTAQDSMGPTNISCVGIISLLTGILIFPFWSYNLFPR